MAAPDVVRASQAQQGIDLFNIFLDDDYSNMHFWEEALPTADIAETSVSNDFGSLKVHQAMTDNNQLHVDCGSQRLRQQRLGPHAVETNCSQDAGTCPGWLAPDDKSLGIITSGHPHGVSASDNNGLTSACLLPTTSSPSDQSGHALRKNYHQLQESKLPWSPHQESPAQPGTSHTSPGGVDSPANCWPSQPQLNRHLALTPGQPHHDQPTTTASNPSLPELAFSTSPFPALAALQTSLPTSQPPQTYNHQQTVPSNESIHPSPSNQPFHSPGAHPALPWQQSTASLNRTVHIPSHPYAPAPTCHGPSPSHPHPHALYGEPQPLAFTSVGHTHMAPPAAPAPSVVRPAVHSAQQLYDGTVPVATFGQPDPMSQTALGRDIICGAKEVGRCWSFQHHVSGGVSEPNGGASGAATDLGRSADRPMGSVSPTPSVGDVAAAGDAALRPSPSFPPFDQPPTSYRATQPGPGPYTHPYGHPYPRPKYYIRRYGRAPAGYGMPAIYMPYRTMPYPPSVPLSRSAAWRSSLHPAPSPANGSPAAAGALEPVTRPETGLVVPRIRAPVPAHPSPYFPSPSEGFPVGAVYDNTVAGNPGGFRTAYNAVKPCDVPMYGNHGFPVYGHPATAGVTRGRFLPSTSHESLGLQESPQQTSQHVQTPPPHDSATSIPTSAPEYDTYASSAAAAGTASVSSCSLAQPWGSIKRPRLAAQWSLLQPATPPTAPSPAPTTPPHPQPPQPPQPPLMAPTQLPQHTTVTTLMTAMSAPENTAPATNGAPPSPFLSPHTMRSVAPTAAAAPANEEDTELQLSLEELYLCIQGLDAEEPISGTASKQSAVGSIGGCVSRAADVADSGAQMAETAKASSCVTLPTSQRLSTLPSSAGSSSRTPAPAAPSALASAEAEAAPMPAGLKAEVETVDTVDGPQDAQQLQLTVKVQTEPTASSGAVAAPPALTAADTDVGHHDIPQLGCSSASIQQQQQQHSSVPAQPSISFRIKRVPQSNTCDGGSMSQQTTANESPSGAVTVSTGLDARKTNRGGFRGPLPRRFFGNTSRQLPASSVALLQQTDRSEPLPGPVTVTVAGGRAPGRSGSGGEGGEGAVVGAGGVVGVFHVLPYLEGAKCIEYGGEMVSRSAFERAGGSMMAKWYRSIKVLPDGMSLGKWLASNNLPILKGNPRCSKKSSRHGEEQDAM